MNSADSTTVAVPLQTTSSPSLTRYAHHDDACTGASDTCLQDEIPEYYEHVKLPMAIDTIEVRLPSCLAQQHTSAIIAFASMCLLLWTSERSRSYLSKRMAPAYTTLLRDR